MVSCITYQPHTVHIYRCACCRWSFQHYMAVQLMKKGFAVGMLVDRLRQKRPVDESTVTEKLELARSDVDEAERIFREV